MADLISIGQSGLNAAQTALNTASNNIANVNTPGYTRRTTELAQVAGSDPHGGVRVAGVERRYAQFLTAQLNGARSGAAAANTQLEQLAQIDNLLGDGSVGLAPRLQDFFDSTTAWAAAPQDQVARGAVLNNARNLTGQFNALAQSLADIGKMANEQLRSAVDQVNRNTDQIANLNRQIVRAQGRGETPNQLLDQRDLLVADTAVLIAVSVTQNDDGSYNLTAGSQPLVDAGGSHALTTVADANDPSRLHVGYVGASGNVREIPDSWVTGGEIGGLLAFAADALAPAVDRLNETASALASAVNAQQAAGFDAQGNPGAPLFDIASTDAAAASITTVMSDPAHLAAAQDSYTPGDNRNANALASLQDAPVVNGDRSLFDNYALMVGEVGSKTQTLRATAQTRDAVVAELTRAEQSVAGVNLDEEYVNLMYYVQMYQANARVINSAATVFDTLLALR